MTATTGPRRNKLPQPVAPIEPRIPKNELAEKAALACLLDNASLSSSPITEAHFYYPDHKLVFNVIKDLTEKKQPVTIITVRIELEAMDLFERAGGDPSRFFDYGGGGNAVLDYYYHHLEDSRKNRDIILFINQHMEDLSKLRIDGKDFVQQLSQLV